MNLSGKLHFKASKLTESPAAVKIKRLIKQRNSSVKPFIFQIQKVEKVDNSE